MATFLPKLILEFAQTVFVKSKISEAKLKLKCFVAPKCEEETEPGVSGFKPSASGFEPICQMKVSVKSTPGLAESVNRSIIIEVPLSQVEKVLC